MKKILILLVYSILGNAYCVSAANAGKTGISNGEGNLHVINNASFFRRVLTGTVNDESGLPIPNVTVKVESSVPVRATTTNQEEKYSIQVSSATKSFSNLQ